MVSFGDRGSNPRISTNFISRGRAVVARWAHNPKVAGSNPAPATKFLSNVYKLQYLQ